MLRPNACWGPVGLLGQRRLKTRAAAVLCALRRGPRSRAQIRNAIGDDSLVSTSELLVDMAEAGLVAMGRGDRWRLLQAGVTWLVNDGVRVRSEIPL